MSAGSRPRRSSPGPASHGTGLAMGLGLDRLLMLRKGIADIRLLRCAADPRVAAQMRDLVALPSGVEPARDHPRPLDRGR